MMNETYQAHDGLPPHLFPSNVPTYTGGSSSGGGSGCGSVSGLELPEEP